MTADVPEITVEELADRLATGRLIDVRERDEFGGGHVPGAENVPLSELDGAIASFRRDETVFIICRSGNRSRTGGAVLREAGINAVSVAGGTFEWRSSGREMM
jgi:rhodanese-related sulfurtransferase